MFRTATCIFYFTSIFGAAFAQQIPPHAPYDFGDQREAFGRGIYYPEFDDLEEIENVIQRTVYETFHPYENMYERKGSFSPYDNLYQKQGSFSPYDNLYEKPDPRASNWYTSNSGPTKLNGYNGRIRPWSNKAQMSERILPWNAGIQGRVLTWDAPEVKTIQGHKSPSNKNAFYYANGAPSAAQQGGESNIAYLPPSALQNAQESNIAYLPQSVMRHPEERNIAFLPAPVMGHSEDSNIAYLPQSVMRHPEERSMVFLPPAGSIVRHPAEDNIDYLPFGPQGIYHDF